MASRARPEAEGADDAPPRRGTPPGLPVAPKRLKVAASGVPATEATDDPTLAARDAGVGVPPLGAPTRVDREVLRAVAAVLGIPDELGVTVPEGVGVGTVHAVAVPVAAPVTGGAVAVGAAP